MGNELFDDYLVIEREDRAPDTFQAKLARECAIMGWGLDGIGKAAHESIQPQNLLGTATELVVGAGVGALMARYASGRGLAGESLRTGGAILSMAFAKDIALHGSEVGAALLDNWQSPQNWNRNGAVVSEHGGRFIFDTALMGVSALVGAGVGHRFHRPPVGPGVIEPLTAENLQVGCDAVREGFFYGKDLHPGLDFNASVNPALYRRLYGQHPDPPMDMHYWLLKDPSSGKAVGTTGLYRYRRDADEAVWLGWTSVLPEHQGKGYGKQLVDFAISEARAGNNKYLRLYTSDTPAEARAQGLYESRGLKITRMDPPDSRGRRVIYRELDITASVDSTKTRDVIKRPIFDSQGKAYGFNREPVTSESWRRIYESEFPATERQSYEFLEGLEKPTANPRVELHVGDDVGKSASFSITSDYGKGTEGRQLLLAYIGVDPSLQSRGIGSQHLRAMLWEMKQKHSDARGLFAEIEDPFVPGMSAEQAKPLERRLEWYKRNGGELLDTQHYLPFTDGTDGKIPARLVWFDFERGGVTQRGIKSFVNNLYRNGYELPADHSLVLMNQSRGEAVMAH